MIDKAILNKILKCLALGRSANEHEAAMALAKARELMEQHGIDDAMLQLAEIEEATARGCCNLKPPRWESVLAQTVCHALSVDQFIGFGGERHFVGRAPRPEIAGYAFTVLFRQLKAARADYIAAKLKRCKPGRKRQRADVFCEGWAVAVLVKVQRLMPAPAEDPAVGHYLAKAYPGLGVINSRAAKKTRAADDYWSGVRRGSEVDVNVGLSSAAPAQKLIS